MAKKFAEDNSQMDDFVGCSEEEILERMPLIYSFTSKSLQSFLAKKVHRLNKEISPQVSHLPAGQSRANQRRAHEARVIEERDNARAVREASDESAIERRQVQVNIAKLALVKTQSDSISLQLRLYQENKEFFIAKNGEAAYIDKVNSLLDKLPDPDISASPANETNASPANETNANDVPALTPV
eukprot:scaffold54583_cov64-Cyclotella_meneghiniana.AAC.2